MGLLLDGPPVRSLDDYRAIGGGEALAAAERLGPALVRQEVLLSGLRGRGGAGFRTGRKWAGVVDSAPAPRFAVCNAAEGEPGTFKDRALLRHDPYGYVEGLAVAAVRGRGDVPPTSPPRRTTSPELERAAAGGHRARRRRAPRRASRCRSSRDRTSTCSARRRRCSR